MNFKHDSVAPFTAFFHGYKLPGGPLEIHSDGRLVYLREGAPEKDILKVNFFKGGDFGTNFPYERIEFTPLQTITLPVLPPFERAREKMPRVVVNPNLYDTPARIFTHLGRIETGPLFAYLNVPFQCFCLFHEYGHYFYETEEYADLFALHQFIKRGGNPSMAILCLERMLKLKGTNPAQITRNKNRLNHLKNHIQKLIYGQK